MRSDVKIGLGVGALLVIAVVVYVIAGPSDKKGEAIDSAKPSNENTSLASTINPTPAPTTAPVVIADPAPTTAPTTNTTLVVGIGGPSTRPSSSEISVSGTALTPSTKPSNSAIASARQGDYDWNNLLAGKQTPPSMSASVGTGNTSTSTAANPFKTPAGKYTVKSGDTLSSIAATNYGNSSRWTDILKANPGLKPSALRVGQSINLPEGSNLKTLAGSTSAETTSSSSTLAESGKTYTVAAGDSLIKISNKVFGDSKHANAIYALNKSKIGSSPSRLKVGMTLKLPAGAPTTRPA